MAFRCGFLCRIIEVDTGRCRSCRCVAPRCRERHPFLCDTCWRCVRDLQCANLFRACRSVSARGLGRPRCGLLGCSGIRSACRSSANPRLGGLILVAGLRRGMGDQTYLRCSMLHRIHRWWRSDWGTSVPSISVGGLRWPSVAMIRLLEVSVRFCRSLGCIITDSCIISTLYAL